MTTYKDAGVDIELGNVASEILYEAAKHTWRNRDGKLGQLVVPNDSFSGLRAIDIGGLPKGTIANLGFDGVGTKMEIGERLGRHDTIAHDLFAMVCDDAVVRGAEPIIIGSVLDVNSLKGHIDIVKQLARGYIEAAQEAGVAVVNGEIAELGTRVHGYGEFNYNWAAGILWAGNKSRILDGTRLAKGDSLVGFQEEGFRSNGLSLVRRILNEHYGEKWHEERPELAEKVLRPSQIYTKAVVDMTGGWDIRREPSAQVHGVAHITGGGLPEKVGRMLEGTGYGAEIFNPFKPSEIMSTLQELGNVLDEEAYKTWNMGTGMVVATPDAQQVIEIAGKYGIKAKKIGKITEQPLIHIVSYGRENGVSLRYPLNK